MTSETVVATGLRPPKDCHLLAIPIELVLEIGHLLTPQDLSRLMKTCHGLNSILQSRLRSFFIRCKDQILFDACNENKTVIIRQALALGAVPKTISLFDACARNYIETVIVLLDDSKLDVNQKGFQKVICRWWALFELRPLQLAIRCRHAAMVEALLLRGAEIDSIRPPLMIDAINKGSLEILRLLLKHGATVHANTGSDAGFKDPVRQALLYQRHMLLPFVERGHHLEHNRFAPRTALGWAVRFRCIETVKLLLSNGCDVNQRQEDMGEMPLHVCCRQPKNIEMMTILLEAGADPDETDFYGQTSLQIAMVRGDVEAVRLLMKWTKSPIHPICWHPVRSRNPKWLEGRPECQRMLDEAGFYTDENQVREALGGSSNKGSSGEEDIQDVEDMGSSEEEWSSEDDEESSEDEEVSSEVEEESSEDEG